MNEPSIQNLGYNYPPGSICISVKDKEDANQLIENVRKLVPSVDQPPPDKPLTPSAEKTKTKTIVLAVIAMWLTAAAAGAAFSVVAAPIAKSAHNSTDQAGRIIQIATQSGAIQIFCLVAAGAIAGLVGYRIIQQFLVCHGVENRRATSSLWRWTAVWFGCLSLIASIIVFPDGQSRFAGFIGLTIGGVGCLGFMFLDMANLEGHVYKSCPKCAKLVNKSPTMRGLPLEDITRLVGNSNPETMDNETLLGIILRERSGPSEGLFNIHTCKECGGAAVCIRVSIRCAWAPDKGHSEDWLAYQGWLPDGRGVFIENSIRASNRKENEKARGSA